MTHCIFEVTHGRIGTGQNVLYFIILYYIDVTNTDNDANGYYDIMTGVSVNRYIILNKKTHTIE